MRKRCCAAEPPFGTLKRMTAGGRFLTRNLNGARTEMTLSVLAYNILRTINMKPSPTLTKPGTKRRPRSNRSILSFPHGLEGPAWYAPSAPPPCNTKTFCSDIEFIALLAIRRIRLYTLIRHWAISSYMR